MVPDKKKKELTENQQAFLAALPDCKGDLKLAKQIAGYSDNTPLNVIVGALKEEIIELCQSILAVNAPKATMELIGAIDKPGQVGMQHKLKAITEILDRVGVVKEEKHMVGPESGLFILPAKKINITHTSGGETVIEVDNVIDNSEDMRTIEHDE